MATRRAFLAAAAAFCALPARGSESAPRLMSAVHGPQDGGALWRPDALESFVLPGRGHAMAHLPDGKVLLMGRRPGGFAAMVEGSRVASLFAPSEGCRFSGHAAACGAELVTAEFDERIEAVLVVRDAANGAELARWRPGGIEPHELLFAGGRLVVALGGLVKDGGISGPAVDPATVRSEVLELDSESGAVRARHRLKEASLSLRHLAASDEVIAVAAQDQDLSIVRPLVGLLRPGKEIEMLPTPDPKDFDFRGYMGSVAINGDFVASASPRGGLAGFWSISKMSFHGALAIADVCGLCADKTSGMFWASSGLGEVLKIDAAALSIAQRWQTKAGFDNHLLMV